MADAYPLRRYRAFGLIIASEVALNELPPDTSGAEAMITIERTSLGRPLPALGEGPEFDYQDPEGTFMAWPGVAAFRLIGADRILVEPYPDVPESYLAFPILGPIMAWMLGKRGLLVLHASALAVHGRSVVLMGDKMAGKSTTAAAFIRAGHRLVTDDLLAIDMADPAGPRLLPAFAQIKLTEESAAAVPLEGAEALPLVFEGFTKRQHRLSQIHDSEIGADLFCVLARGGERPWVETLKGADRFQALMRFSYNVRFGRAPFSAEERASHFRNCVALANRAEVCILHIPADLERLGETVDTVIAHACGIGANV